MNSQKTALGCQDQVFDDDFIRDFFIAGQNRWLREEVEEDSWASLLVESVLVKGMHFSQ